MTLFIMFDDEAMCSVKSVYMYVQNQNQYPLWDIHVCMFVYCAWLWSHDVGMQFSQYVC